MRESKSNTKQNCIFLLTLDIVSMSRYGIPIIPLRLQKKNPHKTQRTPKNYHFVEMTHFWFFFVCLFWFWFIKGSKCNGPIC